MDLLTTSQIAKKLNTDRDKVSYALRRMNIAPETERIYNISKFTERNKTMLTFSLQLISFPGNHGNRNELPHGPEAYVCVQTESYLTFLLWGRFEFGLHINFLLYRQFAVKMLRKREFWPVMDGQEGVDLRFPICDLRFLRLTIENRQ